MEDIEIVKSFRSMKLDSRNLVFFSVPYDEGWTATVNGKPVDVEEVDNGLMAVPAEAGDNTIEFHYETPGLHAQHSAEGQRTAQIEDIALDGASLCQTGDGLVDHGLVDAGRDVLGLCALIDEGLHVRSLSPPGSWAATLTAPPSLPFWSRTPSRSRHPAACRKAEKQGITKKQNVI